MTPFRGHLNWWRALYLCTGTFMQTQDNTHACWCICTFLSMYLYVQTWLHARTFRSTHIYVHTGLNARIFLCTHFYTHASLKVCIFMCTANYAHTLSRCQRFLVMQIHLLACLCARTFMPINIYAQDMISCWLFPILEVANVTLLSTNRWTAKRYSNSIKIHILKCMGINRNVLEYSVSLMMIILDEG